MEKGIYSTSWHLSESENRFKKLSLVFSQISKLLQIIITQSTEQNIQTAN